MTRTKFCGLSHICDIETANQLTPEYIGFVFAPKSKRCITPEKAAKLKQQLSGDIQAVGVFVNEDPKRVAAFLNSGVVDIAQLHGSEDEEYIRQLRTLSGKPVIKAFCVKTQWDIVAAEQSTADYILLDSGEGTGTVFDWNLIGNIKRQYFLAGGLSPENVETAIKYLNPYAVDVSSGIERDGRKDKCKMAEFIAAVRKEERL